ncbi:MAG: hypothetical protein AAGL18_06335 [Pseudomonadota bacterium]
MKNWRRIPAIIRRDKALLLSLGALIAMAPLVINRLAYPGPIDSEKLYWLADKDRRLSAQSASAARLKAAAPLALIVRLPSNNQTVERAAMAHLAGRPVFLIDELGRTKKMFTGRDRNGNWLDPGDRSAQTQSDFASLFADHCTEDQLLAMPIAPGVPNGERELCRYRDILERAQR